MRWALALVVVAATGCSPAEPEPPSGPVTGLIVAIDRGPGGAIEGFTVKDGERTEIRIDPDRDYGFDLKHLEAHRRGRLPVRVTLARRDGDLYAVEILDA